MRRLIIEEPFSRSATWSRRLGWFTLAVTGISVLLVRQGRVELETGLTLLMVGIVLALATLALAILGFSSVWRHGRQGTGRAAFGFIVALILLAWPSMLTLRALTLPAINDVTSDLVDPPAFSRSQAALAARGGRVPADPGPDVRERQRQGYPAIAPIILDLEPAEAFSAVRKALAAQGLQIIEAVPPGGRSGNGRIEAIDRTTLLRFPDDVTIRIRPRADGTRIDIRSASRIGTHDYGANADRIRRLTDAIGQAALEE